MISSLEDAEVLLAQLAGKADCTRRQVGAAVVKDGLLVGWGWNALPDGSCTAGDCPRGRLTREQLAPGSDYTGNCAALHAETAALLMAGPQAVGATVYITCAPCQWCAEAIRDSGAAGAVWPGSSDPAPAQP